MAITKASSLASKTAEANPVVVAGMKLELEVSAINIRLKIKTDNLQCKADTEKEGLRLDAVRNITKLLIKDKSLTGLDMRQILLTLKPENAQATLATGVLRPGLQELVDAKLVGANPYELKDLVAYSLTPLGREVAKLLVWEIARR
jgi:hypothetical protein